MLATVLSDLAVLGITASGPITTRRVAATAKALVPELWHPTSEVVVETIQRLIANGHLRWADVADCIELTTTGTARLNALIAHDPGSLTTPATLAVEIVQFCFLDVADAQTTTIALIRLRRRLEERRRDFELRCQQCPPRGRFTNLWMTLEKFRLEKMVRVLAMIASEAAPCERVAGRSEAVA